jgi:hypothetical protein
LDDLMGVEGMKRLIINVTCVSEPLQVAKPTEEKILGPLWAKYGR